MARNTFSLNVKTENAANFIDTEKSKLNLSKTSFINDLLERLSSWSYILTSHTGQSSVLDELSAIEELLSDDVIKKIPQLAAITRRTPAQMILHLIERGIAADDQLAMLEAEAAERRVSQLSDRRCPDAEEILVELSSQAA